LTKTKVKSEYDPPFSLEARGGPYQREGGEHGGVFASKIKKKGF